MTVHFNGKTSQTTLNSSNTRIAMADDSKTFLYVTITAETFRIVNVSSVSRSCRVLLLRRVKAFSFLRQKHARKRQAYIFL